MEYRLLKTIEKPISYCANAETLNRLSAPNRDYVNPGIGQIVRLYNAYVPYHRNISEHYLTKKTEDQIGGGDIDQIDENIEKEDSLTTKPTFGEEQNNLVEDNSEVPVKKQIEPSIRDSFLHPKIKTSKLIFKEKEKEKPKLSAKKVLPTLSTNKKINHKFQFAN